MGLCKCGAVLPEKRRVCDACRAAAARRAAQRWQEKKLAGQRAAYEAAPKRCPVCGEILVWEKHSAVYCSEECAYEAKKRRARAYNAQARLRGEGKKTRPRRKTAKGRGKAATLRGVVRLLEAENAARRERGEDPLSYGRFVQEKGI